jgi:ERCC4-type nuclease
MKNQNNYPYLVKQKAKEIVNQIMETSPQAQKKQQSLSGAARFMRTTNTDTRNTTTVTLGDEGDRSTSKPKQPGDKSKKKQNKRISGTTVAVPVIGQGKNGDSDDCQKPPAKRARLSRCQDEDDTATACGSSSSSSGKNQKKTGETSNRENRDDTWRAVLLMDSREPRPFLEKLTTAFHSSNMDCEQRPLATFDYLWIATRRKKKNHIGDGDDSDHDDEDELVLDHGVERKEIHDLASGLNHGNKTTGLTRSVEQHLKMNQSGVKYKHYVVQGKIANLYQYPFRFNAILKKRITKHICDLELPNSGYQVHRLADSDPRRRNNHDETIDFLQRLHCQVQAQFLQVHQQQQQQQQHLYSHYPLTFCQFTARAAWVTQVASARKVLPKCALGEKKLVLVLHEFLNAEAFRKAYNDGHDDGCGDKKGSGVGGDGHKAAMIERLINLQANNDDGKSNKSSADTGRATKRRPAFSQSNAEALCAHLVSVTTTTAATTTKTPPPAKIGAAAKGSSRTRTVVSTRGTPTKATGVATSLATSMVTPERDMKATTDKPVADGTTAKTALFVD